MPAAQTDVRSTLLELMNTWQSNSPPTREEIRNSLQEILSERHALNIPGLWHDPPLMLTSSLDDGWGNGLQLVELCGRAAGLRVIPLGLLLSPDSIIAECGLHVPDILGLTVLQFDSEDALIHIRRNLPACTHLVLGGPVFGIDPAMNSRIGAHLVARNIVGFLEFLLKFKA